MRIAQVNGFFYPFMGGIEHRIHNISKRLGMRHEVCVFTSQPQGTAKEEKGENYIIRRLASRFMDLYNPPYVICRGLLEELESYDPDIVDLHYRWAPSLTKDVVRWDGTRVYTTHNCFGEGTGVMKLASYVNDVRFRGNVDKFQKVVGVSEFICRDHVAHGYPEGKMVTVNNGVDLPAGVDARDDGFILSLGRVVRVKGLDHLMRALKEVDMRLVLAGSGPDLDRLKKLAGKNGVEHKVQFLGRVSEEQKADLFSSCSLFVMPSLEEAFGIAAAEAMAYGKPLVVTKVGGLPEVVGDCGLYVPPRDAASLAEALNRMVGDERLRRELGSRGRARAALFSWDHSAELQLMLYESLLA